jgi:hypothetical protein
MASVDEAAKLNDFVDAAQKMAKAQFPDPDKAESDLVTLPGGLVIGDGSKTATITTAQVRELNGEDEEILGRALASENPYHVMNTLLERGVVRLGNEDPKDTPKLLKQMLIGDRDALMIGVRVATYGPEIEVNGWACPECGEKIDATFDLDGDVEVKTLKNARDASFDIKLRKGAVAHIHLTTGEDQFAVGEIIGRPLAERNTRLLEHCVESVKQDEQLHIVLAEPSVVRYLGMADRRTILKELANRQPGPQYNGVKFVHESCGKEVSLAFNLGDLFFS